MIDEVHNLLAGTHREQRRFLSVLRYLSNERLASLVCFGVNEAVDAIHDDVQLARRLDEHHLSRTPAWDSAFGPSRALANTAIRWRPLLTQV